jgi:hypothetical protein
MPATLTSALTAVRHANDHLKTENSRSLATMPDNTAPLSGRGCFNETAGRLGRRFGVSPYDGGLRLQLIMLRGHELSSRYPTCQ